MKQLNGQHYPTESTEVLQANLEHYLFWKPEKVKVILLAESPIFTASEEFAEEHALHPGLLPEHKGPRQCTRQIFSFTYGETAAMRTPKKSFVNTGTTQFWKMFASIVGIDKKPILKTSHKDLQARLKVKLDILKKARRKGIWLLDASMQGLYMPTKKEKYYVGMNGQVQKFPNQKAVNYNDAVVLGWEMLTKHMVRTAAKSGDLKALTTTAKNAIKKLSQHRLEEAINIKGSSTTLVTKFSHPSAWKPGKGNDDKRNQEIADEVNKYV